MLFRSNLVTSGTGDLQWFVDGDPVNGATGNTLAPTQNGVYTVEMTVSPECGFTSGPFDLLNLGIADPATSSVHVYYSASGRIVVMNSGTVTPYELLEMDGKRVAFGKLVQGNNELRTDQLKSGVYLLRTADPAGVARVVMY